MTIDMSTWGWPQWTYLALLGLGLIVAAICDGQPKSGTHRFSASLVGTTITMAILAFGGFFS